MLKELRAQHRNIIQMAFNGFKNQEIAERLGMAQTSVSSIIRSPLGQAYLNGLQDRAHEATLDVRKKLVSLNKDALATFEHLLDKSSRKNVPASVQFNAAKDVLDRNGYKAPDRLNIDMTLQTKTDEELDAEIAAIEAAINKSATGKNLPEIKKSLKQNIAIVQAESFASISSSPCSPGNSEAPNEGDLSLEDFPTEQDFFEPFTDESFEEPALVEDIDILNDLPADLFNKFRNI